MPALHIPQTYSDDRQRIERKRLRPRDVITRAATSELLRQETRPGEIEPVENVLQRQYGGCLATQAYLQRAAVNPAMTTVPTWASELVQTSVLDFLGAEPRASGFAQLAERGALVVPFPANASAVKIPTRASPLTLTGAWVAEGAAKPVFANNLTAAILSASKLSGISVYSEEMLQSTAIEALVHAQLQHDLSALLDSALFDATAASATRPAGLFNGATSVTASAATPALSAMIADLKALGAAVAGTANPDAAASIVFVMNPSQAVSINLLAPQYQNQNLVVSGYMASGSVGAIDASSVAMLIGQPQFQQSRDATLHMDSAAVALAASGATAISSPARSLFQEDLIGLRCSLRAGWVKRRATATAIVSAVTW